MDEVDYCLEPYCGEGPNLIIAGRGQTLLRGGAKPN